MAQTSAAGPAPIPPARKDDSEDVAWALSTAEAMYARGDRGDALKWLRRAAESASEAQDDDRALELAKAAAELATVVGPTPSMMPPPPPPPSSPARPSQAPPARSAPQSPIRNSVSAAVPLASMGQSAPAPQPPLRPATTPLPLNTPGAGPVTPRALVRPAAGTAPLAQRTTEARRPSRRSRPDIEISRRPDEPTQTMQDMAVPLSQPKRRGRASRPAAEELTPLASPTMPFPPPESHADRMRAGGIRTDEIDAWPTQSRALHDDFGDDSADEKTRIGVPAYEASAKMATEVQSTPSMPSIEDTPLQVAQAIRVVVWRTAEGVRVAPHGTHVAAITVDAVLVALDPSADLAAWLAGK